MQFAWEQATTTFMARQKKKPNKAKGINIMFVVAVHCCFDDTLYTHIWMHTHTHTHTARQTLVRRTLNTRQTHNLEFSISIGLLRSLHMKFHVVVKSKSLDAKRNTRSEKINIECVQLYCKLVWNSNSFFVLSADPPWLCLCFVGKRVCDHCGTIGPKFVSPGLLNHLESVEWKCDSAVWQAIEKECVCLCCCANVKYSQRTK